MSMRCGLRVVRGPNWMWGPQDHGPGHIGTVTKYKMHENNVCVRWDPLDVLHALLTMGDEYWYRSGENNAFDLRVLDSTEAGVKHAGVTCDNCDECPLLGMRWKCLACNNYDLCTACYMANVHDLCHQFIRIDSPQHAGTKLSPRCTEARYRVYGMRLADWSGKRPKDFLGYYRDHLPVLGLYSSSPNTRSNRHAVGDTVAVTCNLATYTYLQQGQGGLNMAMIKHMGDTGVVIHLNAAGNPLVQYEGSPRPWTINGQALTKKGGCTCALEGLLLAGAVLSMMK